MKGPRGEPHWAHWNLWKVHQYPSYVSWLSCAVWNFCRYWGITIPDRDWAYIVCLGARGKRLLDYNPDK